jgi:PIN domain nuclease of toxin-antitoxin system
MRRLLLDTHTFLWWLADDSRLGTRTRALIADAKNQVFVSAATAWEISIKKSLGKLEAPDNLDAVVEEEDFEKLGITFFHGERAGDLPQPHRDPFDRMLVAQSQAEGLEIITADETIPKYGIKTFNALM